MKEVILAAALTVALLPRALVAVYDPPGNFVPSGSLRIDFDMEASWKCFFAGGALTVPVWKEDGELNFFPLQLISTVDLGLDFGALRLGFKRVCAHPVAPYYPVFRRDEELVPRWDSAYNMLYLRVETKR